MKCFVYRNLNKKGHVYSLRALEGEHAGKVIGYSSSFWMDDVVFKVSETGRQRTLREKRKNVHAGMVGRIAILDHYEPRLATIEATGMETTKSRMVQIGYNPLLAKTFFLKKDWTRPPVYNAASVHVHNSMVKAALT